MNPEHRLKSRDVQVDGGRSVFPTGLKTVASYNWCSSSTTEHHRIIVPGAPPTFVPPGAGRFAVRKEAADEHRSKYEVSPTSSPLEPLFHSVSICAPGFDMNAVDIVTDRYNLRQLLHFCGCPGDRAGTLEADVKPFKFYAHAIGESRERRPTLAFTCGYSADEVYYGGYFKGFMDKVTAKDSSLPGDVENFHRVIKLDFDGMTLLVRHGVDACMVSPTGLHEGDTSTSIEDERTEQGKSLQLPSPTGLHEGDTSTSIEDERTEQGKSSLQLPSDVKAEKVSSRVRSGLKAIKSGRLINDQVQIMEFKTKNERYAHQLDWPSLFWCMALGGSLGGGRNELVLGLHNRGVFGNVEHLTTDEVRERAGGTSSVSMVYLANTLREVIQAVHLLLGASSGCGHDEGLPRAAVVEFTTPEFGLRSKTLRVRLATPTDDAIAPC